MQTKMAVAKEMNGASFAISEAMWAAGDFKKRVIDAPLKERAAVRISTRVDNVAGVKIPVFSIVKEAGATDLNAELLGLGGGGRQITAARSKFSALLDGLIKLGSLQTAFLTLDEAIKLTNRRVNALDNVIIPSIVDTISYVTSEVRKEGEEEGGRGKRYCPVSCFSCPLPALPGPCFLSCFPFSLRTISKLLTALSPLDMCGTCS